MRDIRVTLVLDPFGIWTESAPFVGDVRDELRTFREIEDLLRRDERFETVTPKTFVVHPKCWEHFQSYRGMLGVAFHEVTPRRELASHFGLKIPDWLTERQVLDWGLLQRSITSERREDWPATLADWLAPGVKDTDDLAGWLSRVATCDIPPSVKDCVPVMQQFRDSFLEVAERSKIRNDIREQLAADLDDHHPGAFAIQWLRRRALLPLMDLSSQNPLRAAGVALESAQQRALTRHLPLVYPLPTPLHAEISKIMRQAVHNARIEDPTAFEAVVLRLEAIWDGLAEELRVWIALQPRSMSQAAAEHLRCLPGIERDHRVRQLAQDYAPPASLPSWPGLQDESAFDCWIAAYARFLRTSFLRRDVLCGADDPAEGFGRWLKDHETVSLAHPQRSYTAVARRVQQVLKRGHAVILVLMDALAIHVASGLADYVTDRFGAEPSWSTHLFAPVPTITAICKEAVLTGSTPDRACGNLQTALLRAYSLEPNELVLSASWEDAERTQLRPTTRLLVHRDNRLDDRLHTTTSYSSLLEDCAGLFARTAVLLARWVDDLRCLHQAAPVVLLTADHGFTYGPPPKRSLDDRQGKGMGSRCIELGSGVRETQEDDPSLTVLDRRTFRLPKDFLAARGRRSGSDTATGWTLAHGGLLPEEVVIPVLEWFGDEDKVPWPRVEFPDGAEFLRDGWILPIELTNPHARPVSGGSITVCASGSGCRVEKVFPTLASGDCHRLELQLAGENLPDGGRLSVDVTIRLRGRRGTGEVCQTNQYLVERAKRLVERTSEQDEFESMF